MGCELILVQECFITVTEVVHILSSDDEEEKAVTCIATTTMQSTPVACSVATTAAYQVHLSLIHI